MLLGNATSEDWYPSLLCNALLKGAPQQEEEQISYLFQVD